MSPREATAWEADLVATWSREGSGRLGWPGRQRGVAGCLPQGSREQVRAKEEGLGVEGGVSALVCKSPGRERHLVQEEAEGTRKNPGAPWGPCIVFTTFKTLFTILNTAPCLKRLWSPPPALLIPSWTRATHVLHLPAQRLGLAWLARQSCS